MNEYTEIQVLSKGYFGTVSLAKSQVGRSFLIQKMDATRPSFKNREVTWKDIKHLTQISHPNMINIAECYIDQSVFKVIIDYPDSGNLSESISLHRKNRFKFTSLEIMRVFVQICLALRYLHAIDCPHRSISCKNVILMQNGMIKLGGFSLSNPLDMLDKTSLELEVIRNSPPESFLGKSLDKASDIWSLGLILFEMFALDHPFHAEDYSTLRSQILYSDIPELPLNYGPECKGMVKKLMRKEINDRPTIEGVLKCSYIQSQIKKLLWRAIRTGRSRSGGSISTSPSKAYFSTKELKMCSIDSNEYLTKGWIRDSMMEDSNRKACQDRMRGRKPSIQENSPSKAHAQGHASMTPSQMRIYFPYDDFIAKRRMPSSTRALSDPPKYHFSKNENVSARSFHSENSPMKEETEDEIMKWQLAVADERRQLQERLSLRQLRSSFESMNSLRDNSVHSFNHLSDKVDEVNIVRIGKEIGMGAKNFLKGFSSENLFGGQLKEKEKRTPPKEQIDQQVKEEKSPEVKCVVKQANSFSPRGKFFGLNRNLSRSPTRGIFSSDVTRLPRATTPTKSSYGARTPRLAASPKSSSLSTSKKSIDSVKSQSFCAINPASILSVEEELKQMLGELANTLLDKEGRKKVDIKTA